MTSLQEEEVEAQAEETFLIAVPIENPLERTSTILTPRAFIQLRTQFGFAENDALLPGPNDTADSPPPGFIAVNRQMCLSGAIPPFIGKFPPCVVSRDRPMAGRGRLIWPNPMVSHRFTCISPKSPPSQHNLLSVIRHRAYI